MSKARDLAYFNIPVLNGATFNLANNTLTATLAQLNSAISDADVPSTTAVTTEINNAINAADAAEVVSVISGNTTAVAGRTYVLTASLILTLPASPAAGAWVRFSNRSGTTTATIARNAQNIMGLAEDLTLDSTEASGMLIFADATRGWVFE